MFDRQARVMGKRSFMTEFQNEHDIAFNDYTPNRLKIEPLCFDSGLPQEGNYGWYSKQLSYKEWYAIACARKAYDEISEDNPRMIF